MNEQQLGAAFRAHSTDRTEPLDAQAEAELAAALLGGDAGAREAGLDRLGRLPQGPQLARVLAALAPEADRLAGELARRRRPARRRVAGIALALAASAAAVAVLVGGLRGGPAEPLPVGGDDRILVASFEEDAASASAVPGQGKIFRSDFDS